MERKRRNSSAPTRKIRLLLNYFFTELMLVRQFSVKNSLIEFHENPTDGLVADTGSETDRQTDRRMDTIC